MDFIRAIIESIFGGILVPASTNRPAAGVPFAHHEGDDINCVITDNGPIYPH